MSDNVHAGITHALTFDVEDYFHVHAYHDVIAASAWKGLPETVAGNLHRLLDLLDIHGMKATFFFLGWVADRHPELVRETAARGHELASHGFQHQAIYLHDRDYFRADIQRAKRILEDIGGQRVYGYRAPTYSIIPETLWALDILAEAGFTYDSSIYPVHHDLYGIPKAQRKPFFISLDGQSVWNQIVPDGRQLRIQDQGGHGRGIVEFPLTTLRVGRINLPLAGGGYFRLFPYPFTRWALKRVEREERPFIFYLHPWEISRSLPYRPKASLKSQIRTNLNLRYTEGKLRRLLTDFSFGPVRNVLQNQGYTV